MAKVSQSGLDEKWSAGLRKPHLVQICISLIRYEPTRGAQVLLIPDVPNLYQETLYSTTSRIASVHRVIKKAETRGKRLGS